jgi:GT2 family glycosyltransferase
MLVRADVFREIQGYDPAYFLTAEDTCDVCRRVRQRGYTIQFTPTAIVTHLTGRSGEQVPFLATLEAYKGSIYYFGKYNGALGRRFAYAIIVLGSLTRMGTSLIKLVVRRKPVDKPNLKIQYSVFRRLISNGSKIAYSSER